MKFNVIILSTLAWLVFSACQPDNRQETDTPATYENDDAPGTEQDHGEVEEAVNEADIVVRTELGQEEIGKGRFQHYSEIKVDVDHDGSPEQIILTADVEVDNQGRAAWSDAHVWEVYVKKQDQVSFLYVNNIQSGKLVLHVDEKSKEVYLEEVGPFASNKYKITDLNKLEKVTDIPENMKVIDLAK